MIPIVGFYNIPSEDLSSQGSEIFRSTRVLKIVSWKIDEIYKISNMYTRDARKIEILS